MSLGGIIGQAPDLNEYLPKSGGTMTGPLILSGNPSRNLEAASKQYVDSKASDWKELSRVSQTYTKTYMGEDSKTFKFTNLWGYTNYKFYMNWDIHASSSGPEGQFSIIYFPSLVSQRISVQLNNSSVSTSFTSQLVLNNYYDTLRGKELEYRAFRSIDASLFYIYPNGTANLTLSVDVNNRALSSHNSTCTITVYGKN